MRVSFKEDLQAMNARMIKSIEKTIKIGGLLAQALCHHCANLSFRQDAVDNRGLAADLGFMFLFW